MRSVLLGSLLVATAVACSVGSPNDAASAAGSAVETGGSPEASTPAPAGDPPTIPLVAIDLPGVIPGRPVTFTVPPGALGFDVIAESATATHAFGIISLRDPSGHEVVQQFTPAGATAPTAINYRGVIASAPVPQTDAFGELPLPGTWTAIVVDYDASGVLRDAPADVHVRIQRTDDGAFHGGRLDLHVHLPPGLHIRDPEPDHTIDATTAATDASMAARLDAFFAALKAQAGIDRGSVTFHPIDASFLSVTTSDQLHELYRQSRSVPDGPGLHFMLTNDIHIGDAEPWGVSDAVGDAATRNGTVLSGVALSLYPFYPASADGLTMLHEAGHFVGLGHTTELDGTLGDSFADTPTCPTLTADWRTTMTGCPDRLNLMFPVYYAASRDGTEKVSLSAAQARTFRGSPIYRAYAH